MKFRVIDSDGMLLDRDLSLERANALRAAYPGAYIEAYS